MVMDEIAKNETKQQLTLTTPPNLTQTSSASINGNLAADPNHSSTSQIDPQSQGLDDVGMDDDNLVWSKMSKLARTVGKVCAMSDSNRVQSKPALIPRAILTVTVLGHNPLYKHPKGTTLGQVTYRVSWVLISAPLIHPHTSRLQMVRYTHGMRACS
jgi:hypothetical protein